MKKRTFLGFIAFLFICLETAKGAGGLSPRLLIHTLYQGRPPSKTTALESLPRKTDLQRRIALKQLRKRVNISTDIDRPTYADLSLIQAPTNEEIIDMTIYLIEQGDPKDREAIARFFFTYKTRKLPELVKKLIEHGDQQVYYNLVYYTMNQPHWSDRPDLLFLLIEKGNQKVHLEAASLLSTQDWIKNEELIEFLAIEGDEKVRISIVEQIFPRRDWITNKKLFSVFMFDEAPAVREAIESYAAKAAIDEIKKGGLDQNP